MKHSCGTALDSRGARLRSNPTPGIYRNGRVLPRCLTFRVRLDFVFIADTTGTRTMTCGTGTTRGPRPPPRRRRRTGNIRFRTGTAAARSFHPYRRRFHRTNGNNGRPEITSTGACRYVQSRTCAHSFRTRSFGKLRSLGSERCEQRISRIRRCLFFHFFFHVSVSDQTSVPSPFSHFLTRYKFYGRKFSQNTVDGLRGISIVVLHQIKTVEDVKNESLSTFKVEKSKNTFDKNIRQEFQIIAYQTTSVRSF